MPILLQLSLLVLLLLLHCVHGVLFTLRVHQSECFFESRPLGAKCAVRFQVQTATRSLDVDLDIYDSSGTAVFATHAQQAGVAVFNVEMSGSYRVCFSTRFSSMGEKQISLEIDCGDDASKSPRGDALQSTELSGSAEEVRTLTAELTEVYHEQRRLMSRVHTHHDTAESTNRRVSFWSLLELLLVVALAALQVLWLRKFVEQKRPLS